VNPSQQILLLIVSRFLCRRNNDLTWTVSPKAAKWLIDRGISVSNSMLVAHDDEMASMRDLRNHEVLIHSRHDYFAEVMRDLVTDLPKEVDNFTSLIRPDEYRILLVYGGREVYDFFVRDHRFGPPPRGKMYRSNLRGDWRRPPTPRPDNALLRLRKKIDRLKSYGADVHELEAELQRRKDCIARGEDPLAGSRRGEVRRAPRKGPDDALELVRSRTVGAKVPDGWAAATETSSDAERDETTEAPEWGKGPVGDRAPGEW
jgi:hypothetical protein